MDSNLLRKLPRIDDLLNAQQIQDFSQELPREVIAGAVRAAVEKRREAILAGDVSCDESCVAFDAVVDEVVTALYFLKIKSLRRVINGTGVVLHTNLGRANLSAKAKEAVAEVADHYSTLEYDPKEGKRGSRHSHVENVIKEITGAESAMVVNNNAAATMLCLAAMGRGREIIISRGELVEIGGSFRVPEMMEESGAHLVEVGTTNKTRVSDYERAITEETGALMKVHTSNYKIIGFTEDVSISQLKELGCRYDLPVIYDMGSGLMTDLSAYGISEPTVKAGLAEGADVILFSGDKLLGGPQGGILAGKKKYIDMMKSHPLARVLRVDKMTLAAMEATFRAYYDEESARQEIPVLAMLTRTEEQMKKYADSLKSLIDSKKAGYVVKRDMDKGMVGGGSAPSSYLDNVVLKLYHDKYSAQELATRLRDGKLPVVARIRDDELIIDMRTVMEDELALIAERLEEIAR